MCLHCTKNPRPRSLLSTQSFSHRSDNVTPSSSSHSVAVRNDIRHGTMRNGAVRPWGRSPQRHTTVQLTQSATTYDNYTSHSLRSLARMPQIRQVLHPSSYGNDVPRKRFYTGQSASRGNPVHWNPRCHKVTCFCACQSSAPSDCFPASSVIDRNQQIPTCFTDTCLDMLSLTGRSLRAWVTAREAACFIQDIRNSTMLAHAQPVIIDDRRWHNNQCWRNHGASTVTRTATSQVTNKSVTKKYIYKCRWHSKMYKKVYIQMSLS